jgi:hypothetical protein
MRVARTRGAVGGVVIALLGLWGALIPFVGPSFSYVVGPDQSWHWTAGRFWLSVLPGIVAIVGGLLLATSARRPTASFGALLGVAAGAWFVVGPTVSELWNHGVSQAGVAHGAKGVRVLEQLGYFSALGALILYFAAAALGRLSVRSVRDVELAEADTATAAEGAAQPGAGRTATAPTAERTYAPAPAAAVERPVVPPASADATPPETTPASAGTPAASAQPAARRGGLLSRLRS